MPDRCVTCLRPKATQQDFDSTREGEGDHLCWAAWGDPCPEVSREELLLRMDLYRESACPGCVSASALDELHICQDALLPELDSMKARFLEMSDQLERVRHVAVRLAYDISSLIERIKR